MKRFIITMELKDIIKIIITLIVIILLGILIFNLATGTWTLNAMFTAIQNIFQTIISGIIDITKQIYEHNKQSFAYLFGAIVVLALFAAFVDQ